MAADPPPALTLLVKKGPCEGKTLQRRAGTGALRIGRVAKGNDLSVGDAGASQRHLSVEFLPPPAARWAVTDLGSSNGTLLNGTPLVATIPAPLSDGDIIKIGETTMLAVSISTDAGPGPGPAATRRTARNVAATAEEQGPAVSRRAGRRKAGPAEAPEAGNEVEKEAALPTRRGGRKKAGAAEASEAGNEVEEEAALPTRRGGRKKAGAAEASEAGNEVEEEAALPTRRGGRKKAGAAEAPEAGNEVEEEAALPTRRGGRKKAVEPTGVETEAEDEEEEAAIPRRGRSRKAAATVVLPPQPRNTRSTRAAARRGEVLGCENNVGEVVRTGTGRGRVTWASPMNGTRVSPEEEEEGELAVTRDREGTAAEGKGEEVVPAAGKGRARRGRGGRGGATRASTRKAEDAIVENDENEQEERDMAGGKERGRSPSRVLSVNDSSKEDKLATEDDKLDGTLKASVEDEKMVDVEEDVTLTERATEGRVNAQHAPADNGGVEEEEEKNLSKGGEIEVDQELREKMSPGSKLDGVGEAEKNDKREAIGAGGEKGHVGEREGKHRLENMTLGEWFVQIEKYLLAKNEKAAEKAIAEVQEKHWQFCEHVKTLNLKKSPAP